MGKFKRKTNAAILKKTKEGKYVVNSIKRTNGKLKDGLYTVDKSGKLELLMKGVPADTVNEIKQHYSKYEKAYIPEAHPRLAYDLCWQHGYTLEDLSKAFNVDINCIGYWFRVYDEFHDAVMAGKDARRIDKLESALQKKACGFEYYQTKEESIELPAILPLGARVEVPAVKKTIIKKQVQPSMQAIEFALTNRNNERWSKPQQNVRVDQNIKQETKTQTIDWTELARTLGVEGLEQLKRIMGGSTQSDNPKHSSNKQITG